MKVPKVFWLALAIFQIAVAGLVFLVTRSYYLEQSAPVGFAADLAVGPAQQISSESGPPLSELVAPQSREEIAELADTHFASRQYEAAAVLYRDLVDGDRTNVDLLNNLAITLHYIGRSPESLELIDEGIAVDANHQRIWLTRGFILSELGDTAAATDALTTAISIDAESEIGVSAGRMLDELASR